MSMQSLASHGLAANWFDAVVVGALGVGLFRGRKNGMSKEVLPLFQWLTVIVVSGLLYSLVARLLVKIVAVDLLTSYVLGYAIVALVVFFVFSVIKRTVGLKLFASNVFGSGEYYLGMSSGLVRFGCMVLFALALLNARYFTTAQIRADNEYQARWYGAHFFPDLYNVQAAVFKKSLTGPYIKQYLSTLLIQPTATGVVGNQPVQHEAAR